MSYCCNACAQHRPCASLGDTMAVLPSVGLRDQPLRPVGWQPGGLPATASQPPATSPISGITAMAIIAIAGVGALAWALLRRRRRR